jgi:peptide/nickel transport system substrate-binding protein
LLFDGEGQYDGGAVLQPPPEGIWGMPREKLEQLTEYGLDVSRSHEEARALMRLLGYGPDARLKVKADAQRPPDRHEPVGECRRRFVPRPLPPGLSPTSPI